MALTKCPECGKKVSTNAETCPHCGNPLKTKEEPAPSSVHVSSDIEKVYMRDKRHRWIGEIVASVISIILGIVLCAISGIFSDGSKALLITFIVCGVILIIVGIIGIIYYAWRLRNY